MVMQPIYAAEADTTNAISPEEIRDWLRAMEATEEGQQTLAQIPADDLAMLREIAAEVDAEQGQEPGATGGQVLPQPEEPLPLVEQPEQSYQQVQPAMPEQAFQPEPIAQPMEASPQQPESTQQPPAEPEAPAASSPVSSSASPDKPELAPQQSAPAASAVSTQAAVPSEGASTSASATAPSEHVPVATHPSAPSPAVEQKQAEPISAASSPVKQAASSSAAPVMSSKTLTPLPAGGELTTTADDRRGNWYYKRKCFQEARRIFDQVRSMMAKLELARTDFQAIRASTDEQCNQFYSTMGFEQGELFSWIESHLATLEKERAQQGQLDEQGRIKLAELNDKKRLLENARHDLTAMQEDDKALTQAGITLSEQITRCTKAEQDAWMLYETIGEILNDQRAAQLLESMKAKLQFIQDVERYLQGEFLSYVNALVNRMQGHTERLNKQVADLKSRGIVLSKPSEPMSANGANSVSEKAPEASATDADKPGIFTRLFSGVKGVLGFIGWVAMTPVRLLQALLGKKSLK
jgi:rubrerythrin